MPSLCKIVVTVPETHADVVREVMGKAGAGRMGHYVSCSFSSKGVGRFLPLEGAHPAIGNVGHAEEVVEERVEVTCSEDLVTSVIKAIREVHPYEEPAIDVYALGRMDRVEAVEERNARVEADKAWETSFARRGLLVMFTYLAIGLYLAVIHVERPWINAIVPAVGFMLSTLTLPWFKKKWLHQRKNTLANSSE